MGRLIFSSFSGVFWAIVLVMAIFMTTSFGEANSYIDLDISQARELMTSDPDLVILDVRSQEEYDSEHLPNATLIPSTELTGRLGELDSQKDILVYCSNGSRSATASQVLVDNGFSSVYNMLGGITAWKHEGYWTETVHDGDLIINGMQTYTIENCTYAQRGNVFVSGSAMVTIRNAIFRIDLQDYWHQYEFSVNDTARLEMSDSTVDIPKGAWLSCGGNSRVNISQSSLQGMPLSASGSSNIIVDNTSYGSNIDLWGNFRMTILNSTIEKISLNLEPRSNSRIEGLRPGYFGYLNLRQNQSEVDVEYELTVVNSSVTDWSLSLTRYDTDVVVSDSSLYEIWIWYVGTTAEIYGVKDGSHYEHLDINNLELTNTSVSHFTFAARGSRVELRNTTAGLHLFDGFSNVSIYDSDLGFLARGERGIRSVGVLLLDDSSLSVWGLFDSELYIGGNITHVDCGGDWFWSNVTRNYSILAKDAFGDPLENVELTLVNSNGTAVWDGTADSLGKADFNLTFTDSNYTSVLKLEGIKGNLSAAADISFLSDTPAVLTLGLHDLAVVDVTPIKTVVGEGFSLPVDVTIMNQGTFNETCSVTLYANETGVGTLDLYNPAGESATLTISWNTTGFELGNYTLTACAAPVPYETDTVDNNLTLTWIWVGLPGDAQAPFGSVDMKDVSYVARRFMCIPSDPLWDPVADVNGDGKIDMKDISTVARHFGEYYP